MINVKTLYSKEVYNNTYIIRINDKCYIVDPTIDIDTLKENVSKVDGVIVTHSHFDHIYMLEETLSYYKCKLYIHENSKELIYNSEYNCALLFQSDKRFDISKYDVIYLKDYDIIDGVIKVLHTPGHTSDSICLFLMDNNEKHVLISGDTLFNQNIGRFDLYSGNINELKHSIIKIYNECPSDTFFYPGHGFGSTLERQLIDNYNYYVCSFINNK